MFFIIFISMTYHNLWFCHWIKWSDQSTLTTSFWADVIGNLENIIQVYEFVALSIITPQLFDVILVSLILLQVMCCHRCYDLSTNTWLRFDCSFSVLYFWNLIKPVRILIIDSCPVKYWCWFADARPNYMFQQLYTRPSHCWLRCWF